MSFEKLKRFREVLRVSNEIVTCESLADRVNKLLTYLEHNGQSLNRHVLNDKRDRFNCLLDDIHVERERGDLASIDLSVVKINLQRIENECQVCLVQVQKTVQDVDVWLKTHPVSLIFRRSDFIKKP